MPEYFALADLRALPDVSDAVKYPDASVEAAAAYVVGVIERVAFPFVERTVTGERHSGTRANRNNRAIVVSKRLARSVTALTENGIAYGPAELAQLVVDRGVIRRYASAGACPMAWAEGVGNITITYTYGFSTVPPADVKEAALQATRHRLLTARGKAGVSDRAKSITNEQGNIALSTAGVDGPFGIPEVDEVVVGYVKRRKSPLIR